jgi:hypothetical protein
MSAKITILNIGPNNVFGHNSRTSVLRQDVVCDSPISLFVIPGTEHSPYVLLMTSNLTPWRKFTEDFLLYFSDQRGKLIDK